MQRREGKDASLRGTGRKELPRVCNGSGLNKVQLYVHRNNRKTDEATHTGARRNFFSPGERFFFYRASAFKTSALKCTEILRIITRSARITPLSNSLRNERVDHYGGNYPPQWSTRSSPSVNSDYRPMRPNLRV